MKNEMYKSSFFSLMVREAFCGFEPNVVAKMGEKEIMNIASNRDIVLVESRVRSIVDNSKCILKASSVYFCLAT